MSAYQDETTPDPVVAQRAEKPSGPVPRGRQPLILLAAAVLIVGAVVFTGSTSTPTQKPIPSMKVNTPSKSEIDRYTDQLRQEEARLALARDAANRAKTDYTAMNRSIENGIPGQAVIGPNGQPYYPAPGYQQPPQVNALEAAREKKEYDSLFASNIAFSLRPKEDQRSRAVTPATVQTVSDKPEAAPEEPKKDEVPTHKLFEGTIIETVLTNRLEGEFAGPVNCQVSNDVYSHNGQTLLIPRGSRLLGEARKVDNQDQRRLAVMFHRLIMPDGYSVNLDKPIGLNQEGGAALKDKVNKHYLSTFGTSIAIGLLAGFSMYGTQGVFTGDGTDLYRQGVSSQLGRTGQQILQRQLNRMPEITIREGHRVKILLSSDISLPAYNQHPPTPGL